jgi:HAD superfamily hydrolase (TIGR01484 family)
MIMYKALILDLDGTTILNEVNALPSKKVSDAIFLAREKIHVCVATGRPLHIALPVIEHLNLSGPCTICGGIQLYDPVEKKIIKELQIDNSKIPQIIDIAKRHQLKYGVYDGKKDIAQEQLQSAQKILEVYLPVILPDKVDEIEKELLSIENVAVHKMPSWEKGYLSIDIANAEATKLHGINDIIKILKITKDEVIGVGDSYNDYPLLMASGLKIAMGNAIPELKAIADFIAPSVAEDGVATIIEKFILRS